MVGSNGRTHLELGLKLTKAMVLGTAYSFVFDDPCSLAKAAGIFLSDWVEWMRTALYAATGRRAKVGVWQGLLGMSELVVYERANKFYLVRGKWERNASDLASPARPEGSTNEISSITK